VNEIDRAGGGATPEELRRLLRHRQVGAALLAGEGLEIGALHYPLVVPGGRVRYLDVEDRATLRTRFPELAAEALVEPTWIGDVVQASVPAITGRHFDFIVVNHVLEHIANPIQALANVWDGLRERGMLVLSVPDKQFTFDRERPLTTFAHVLAEFFQGVTEVDASHYVELLEHTRPDVFSDRGCFVAALAEAAARREHAHVWDSDAFRTFMARSASTLGLVWEPVYESAAAANHFEYFVVLRKGRPPGTASEDSSLRVLAALYRARNDLQSAFPASEPRLARRLLRWATTAGAEIDSDAAALRTFQDHYRRLIHRLPDREAEVEEALRASLSA
jgi:SAM-dependent methyltransferase